MKPFAALILAGLATAISLHGQDREDSVLPLNLPQAKSSAATADDPEGARGTIWALGAEKRLTLPVEQRLPDGTTSIGLWVTERRDNFVRFILTDQAGRKTAIDAGCLEGMAPGPKQVSWVSHQAGLGPWHLRRVFLRTPAKDLTLSAVEIERLRPEKELRIGPLLASARGANPFSAKTVWKLKDYETPKPDSTFWTGSRYYEYGFATDPVLRTAAWRMLLGGAPVASLRLVLKDMNGHPLWHTLVGWQNLGRPIPLPGMPEGCYLLEVTGFDTSNHLAATGRLVYQTLRSDTPPDLRAPDAPAYPWTINGLKLGGPAAAAGDPLGVEVDASPLVKDRAPVVLDWNVTDHAGVRHGGGRTELLPGRSVAKLALPAARPGGYKLRLQFADTTGPLDEAEYRYGVSGQPPGAVAAPGRKIEGPLMLNQLKVHHDADHFKRLPTGSLPAIAAWTFQYGMSPCYLIFWGELEPVEGCYNWHLIDQYLELAKDGRTVAIGINFSGDNLPEWLWFEELMSQGQQTIHHDYHYVTPLGPRFQQAHAKLWQAVLERYRGDPRVAAWIYQAGPSEGFLTDTPPKIADYSPESVAAFQDFLRTRYGTIEKLNAAWKASFPAFASVRPPLPDFSKSWEWSLPWWDFHLFKTSFVPAYLERVQARARAADADRPMIMYAKEGFGAPGLLGPVFRRNGFTYSNGGGESPGAFVQSSLMRRFDVPVMSENGDPLPPSVATASAMCAYSILAGGFTGQMLQSGLVWTKVPFPEGAEYEELGKMIRSVSQNARELSQAKPAVDWCGYYSATTELLQSRSMRCRLYPSVLALLDAAQVRLNNSCSWVDDATPVEILQTTPLIVDGGSTILAADAVANLLRYVENGGTYVCDATAGTYEPGTEEPTHRLLREIGAASFTARPDGAGAIPAAEGMTLTLKKRTAIAWSPGQPVRVLVTDPQGDPVVWERTLGQGRIILIGGEINWPESAAWLGSLVAAKAGKIPYHIEGDESICGVLRGPEADYVVIRPLLLEGGAKKRDVRIEDIRQAGNAHIRIRGVPAAAACTELIGGYAVQRSGDAVTLDVPRAMLAVVRIARAP